MTPSLSPLPISHPPSRSRPPPLLTLTPPPTHPHPIPSLSPSPHPHPQPPPLLPPPIPPPPPQPLPPPRLGRMYRRVITTVVYSDGSSLSTAQDYVFDIASDRWFESSSPYDYHGPGVAPGGAAGGRSSYCGDDDGEAVGKSVAWKA